MNYEIITNNPYDGRPLPYNAKGILIMDKWVDALEKVIIDHNINALFLNSSKGWDCDNYSFLKNIPNLLIIDIIHGFSDKISTIEFQIELKEVSLNMPIKENIDFNFFKNLETCFIPWSENVNSIFDIKNLKKLYIDGLKTKDNHKLLNLINLEELVICNSNIMSLDFLMKIGNNLKILELLDCKKIKDFTKISMLQNLVRLNIDGYKDIYSIDFVSGLKKLEILLLDVGKIDSIKSLVSLKTLKVLAFGGTTTIIVDGDLEPMTRLNELSMLMIVDRKHYNYKLIKPWNWANFGKPDKLILRKTSCPKSSLKRKRS